MQMFGPYLKALRKQKGFTLEKLGKKSGVRKGYLSGVENGKVNPPSPKAIRTIARALETDRKELLLLAYIAKAPAEIRPQLEEFFTVSGVSA